MSPIEPDQSAAPVSPATTATSTPTALPGYRHLASGKVRELFEPEEPDGTVLVVASDRISSYDFMLTPEIPDKGAVLTRLSRWWFDRLADVVPNHLVEDAEPPAAVADRAMVCRKLDMLPVECVARGYLTGSGLAEYRAGRTVCGIPLPEGLTDASRLAEPIFTPARKADLGDHDENIDFARTADLVGADTAAALRDATLALYSRAEQIAREAGIILADTKFEFGFDPATGALTLGDEVLTPDSSRFWDAAAWREGESQASFDKQYVRDWLTSPAAGWDRAGGAEPPALPAEVVDATRARYVEAYERLTGESF